MTGASVATTTVEVIQEFAHVFARRRDRGDASRLARAWAALLAPLISTTRDDLEQGLTLYERNPRLGAFDAVLAAAALAREAEARRLRRPCFRGGLGSETRRSGDLGSGRAALVVGGLLPRSFVCARSSFARRVRGPPPLAADYGSQRQSRGPSVRPSRLCVDVRVSVLLSGRRRRRALPGWTA